MGSIFQKVNRALKLSKGDVRKIYGEKQQSRALGYLKAGDEEQARKLLLNHGKHSFVPYWEKLGKAGYPLLAIELIKCEKKLLPKHYYGLGLMHMYLLDYEQAEKQLLQAVFLSSDDQYKIRLASCYQRMEKFQDAIDVLNKINLDYDASKYGLHIFMMNLIAAQKSRSVAADYLFDNQPSYELVLTNQKLINMYKLAEKEYNIGNYSQALDLFFKCLYSTEEQAKLIMIKIGNCYYQLGNKEQAFYYYRQYEIEPIYPMPLSKPKGQYKIVANYVELYENLKIEDEYVLYCSYTGKNFSGSPLAIFKQLIISKPELKHFIIVNEPGEVDPELLQNDNVFVVKYNSYNHYRLLAIAKYLVVNTSMPFAYIQKPEQKVLNTWHGTPLKNLGYDVRDSSLVESRNVKKALEQATHLIHPNQFTEDVMAKAFGLTTEARNRSLVTGYPRQDLMLGCSIERKAHIKKLLNITDNKKVVLYAPTYRDFELNAEDKNIHEIEQAVSELSKRRDINFLFKGHYLAPSASDAIKQIDTNELLSIVDILITDYSSIGIDFLALERPIIYYTFDKKDYEHSRGMYIDITSITDLEVKNYSELEIKLNTYLENPQISEKQANAKQKYCSNDDGNATNRVINYLFEDQINPPVEKKSILIYGGNFMRRNGISVALNSFLDLIDTDKFEITLLINEKSFKVVDDESSVHDYIKRRFNIVYYYGTLSRSLEENYALKIFKKNKSFINDRQRELIMTAMSRNGKRIFGNKQYDYVIDYGSGYAQMINIQLSALIAHKKFLFLHSDMQKEMEMRFPNLEANFNVFNNFDEIFTVSDAISDINKQFLSEKYNIDSTKFSSIYNEMNFKKIEDNAKKQLEVETDNQHFGTWNTFISIGRFSPEKNVKFVIDAFKLYLPANSNDKLLLIGYGPEQEQIERHIVNCDLANNVIVVGYRENPYNYLSKSTAMLFASLHEGQGLVLMEALALNIPYVSLDIPAAIEINSHYKGGLLSSLNAVEYAKQIRAVIENDYDNKFNVNLYNQQIKQVVDSKIY